MNVKHNNILNRQQCLDIIDLVMRCQDIFVISLKNKGNIFFEFLTYNIDGNGHNINHYHHNISCKYIDNTLKFFFIYEYKDDALKNTYSIQPQIHGIFPELDEMIFKIIDYHNKTNLKSFKNNFIRKKNDSLWDIFNLMRQI